MTRSRHDHVWLLIVVVSAVLLAVPTLVLPPGRDQAIYLLVGRIVAEGGALYRDAFDFKPPGVLLQHAALAHLAPGSTTAGRWLDVASLLLGIVAITRLLRPEGRIAWVVGGLFHGAVALLSFRYWDLGQPEWTLASLVPVALLAFRGARSLPWLGFVSGTVFGWAFVLKYPAILYLPLVLLVATRPDGPDTASTGRRFEGGRRIGAALGLLVAGFVVVVGGVALALVPGGGLSAWLEIQREYIPGYTGLLLAGGPGIAIRESARLVADFLLTRPAWLLAPVLSTGVLLMGGRGRARFLPLAGMALGAAGLVAQGKLFHYHWIPILPMVSLGVGHATGVLVERIRAGTWPRWLVPAAGAMLLAAVALTARPTLAERRAALDHLTGRLDTEAFHAHPVFGTWGVGDHALSATEAAATRLAALTRPGDEVFVWGFEPLLYLAADRPPASRFIYNAPFLSPWCPRGWIDELVRGLTADPPGAIVVVGNDAIPWVTGVPLDSRAGLRYFPDLVSLLRSRYQVAAEVEDFTLFTLTDPSPSTP